MKYTNEFKTKCFNTLRYSKCVDIVKLMKDLDSGNDTQVRFALEAAVEDKGLFKYNIKVCHDIDDNGHHLSGETKDKFDAYADRFQLYSEFMELYTNECDKQKETV